MLGSISSSASSAAIGSSRLASARSTLARVEESGVLVYPIQYNTEDDVIDPYIFGRGRGRGPSPPPIYNPWPFPRFPRGRGGRGRRWPFDPLVNNQFPRGTGQDDYRRASQYLRDLAERSGARLYHAESLDHLTQSFSLIAEELRHQYALSYYPTHTAHDGSYRRIRVSIDRPNLVVRARDGYRAGGEEQAHDGTSSKDKPERPSLKKGKQLSDEK